MKKPPAHCDYNAPGSYHMRRALDGLAHFHVEHTGAGVTIWEKAVATQAADGAPETRPVLMFVTSDPAIIRQVKELLKPYMGEVILDDGAAPPQVLN